MNFEYLLFNVTIALSSTVGTLLYPNSSFPRLKPTILAILIISIPFILWDQLVTNRWWTFNPSFVLGWEVGKLPIEEILFFFVIPWSCLIIWENLKKRVTGTHILSLEKYCGFLGVIISAGALFSGKEYSFSIGILLLLTALLSTFTSCWLSKKNSLTFLTLVFLLIVTFNGYLTARPIVLYNETFMSAYYLFTIPFEDIVYGLSLVAGIVMMYEKVSGIIEDD